MTLVSINKKNDAIISIKVSGHSGYASEGSDIVCSAVSTALYVSIGLLDKLNVKYDLKEDASIPLMELTINEVNDSSNMVMENLFDALESIASDYKQYVKIK